jgi:hypothetical protein
MRYRRSLFALTGLIALGAAASSASAQARAATTPASIDSAMTKAMVVERFGTPTGERSRGAYTYLFFSNGREKQVGMSDVVVLMNNMVVDAILRSPSRAYTGTSSSPVAMSAKEAARSSTGTIKSGGDAR